MASVDESIIEAVLLKYGAALDARSTADVKALRDNAAGARFMPNHYLPSNGPSANTAAYDTIFATISLTIAFDDRIAALRLVQDHRVLFCCLDVREAECTGSRAACDKPT